MTKTIYAMPNPYCQLDHKGRLAGACPVAGSAPSANAKVGAKLRQVDGSYNDRQEELQRAIETGQMKTVCAPVMFSRSEMFYEFTAVQPVAISVSPSNEAYYINRFRSDGSPPCLIACKDALDFPLEALAEQRLNAIEAYNAAYGKDPPTGGWKLQFELDDDVTEMMVIVAERRAAAKATAKADAEKLQADMIATAKSAQDKRLAARRASIDEAKKRAVEVEGKAKAEAAKAAEVEAKAKADAAEAAKSKPKLSSQEK